MQSTTGQYAIHQFKDFANGYNSITLNWNGQSNVAPSTSAVYLQIYNYNSSSWETLDSDNISTANTDFDLTGSIANLTNYKDGSSVITSRVYQLGV